MGTISRSLVLRLFAFFAGLCTMALGIVLVVRPGLGTSPISSPSYVLSLLGPLSFGLWTFLFTLIFFIAELLVLGRESRPALWLQLPASPILGIVVDHFMALIPDAAVAHPLLRAGLLASGCVALALGIWLQVKADVVINPGEGIVKALAWRTGRPFGSTKLVFDASLVLLAAGIGFAASGRLLGVGLGTAISALTVGPLVRILDRLLTPLWRRHVSEESAGSQP